VRRNAAARWPVWLLAMSATVCAGAHQKHEQASPQESVSVQDSLSVNVVRADDIPVKTGEDFSFTVTLDRGPNFKGASVQWRIDAPGEKYIVSGTALYPGQRDYTMTYLVPAGSEEGTWILTITGIWDGSISHPFPNPPRRTFQVIANRDLVLPTSASIVINPSQQQLLRKSGRILQLRIQNLKAAIASYQEANQQGRIPQVLRTNVDDALKALQTTETEFKKLATAQSQSDVAQVFFGDLRLNYDEVLQNLEHSSADISRPARFVNAAFSGKTSPTTPYPVLAQAALRAFEANELAYNIAAENSSLTFNLKVTSDPAGAAVSYYRRGDSPHSYDEPTNTTIPSLTYAIWYVKFEKQGYKPQVREHDPFHSTDHVLHVELTR